MLPNRIEWLRLNVFPEAVQARAFGADTRTFVSFEPINKKATDQFCSDILFGDVTIEKEDGQLVTESVVIKFQPSFELTRKWTHCNAMFHNEILFYSKIIPLFRKYDTDNILSTNFCEFVYGKATNDQNPEEDVIILKSIHEKGFKLTDEKVFIDERHIKLALDKIAKFHALSFKCQSDDLASFRNIVSQIKNPDKDIDEEIIPKNFQTLCSSRGVDHLQNHTKYKDRLRDVYKQCEQADGWLKKNKGPSGPLNVIVHGDFTRNNMMFKYGNSGEPTEVIFFDMAIIRYCSPVIDTSVFLFLNTSPEAKRLHWDNFFQTYYDSLSMQLNGHPAKPSLEDVELDWRKRGIYGYHCCSLFLPSVMEAKTKEEWGENAEALLRNFNEMGGLKVTEYLAEMVKHMLDKNYIFED